MDFEFILVLQIILLLSFNFQFIIPSSASLSTLSISETSNQVLVCSLIPSNSNTNWKSVLNCTNFPIGNQIPVNSPNVSISAITAGNGFECLISPKSPSICTLGCWRFSGNGTNLRYKRIYKGPMLDELDAGNSHICARIRSTNRVKCWQWPDFDSGARVNLSGIAVGGEFLCGFNESKKINCLGYDQGILNSVPTGDFSVIEAGNEHVCAISTDGSLNCWGKIEGKIPTGEFKKLALGNNRSCALRENGTIVCWGENDFNLPQDLQGMEFTLIEAKNSVFCGILARNFSVFCWGNDEFFSPYSMVFGHVQAGPCTTECPCKFLPGSGYFCNEGSGICPPCSNRTTALPLPPSKTESDSSNGGNDKRKLAFLVLGCVGTFSLVIISCFFLFKFCKARVCRVHDSGRLDQVIVEPPPIGSTRHGEPQIRPVQASLEKRLSQLYSMSHLEEFTLEMLLKVTGNFSKENKIGHGSFGFVYRATLDDGREVAIKRAELLMTTSSYAAGAAGTKRQDDKENAFISELAHLSRLNHKNLVRLLGYCDEENERVLVYEYMAHGTLHDHLHKFETAPPLNSWTARLKVALDAARGIEYLHTYAVPSIIHRDIKSSNILLDASWTAKVSDFGLSLMGPEDHESHLSLRAAGTVGYMDPEYYRLQQLTTKSDVYSFGVLLLELLSGFKAIHPNEAGVPRNVVDFAVPYIIDDEIHCLLDPKLPAPTPYEIEAVTYVGYLAADCVNLEGRNRPSMTEVVSSLEKALAACEAPQILSRSTTRSAST
ncbi:Protein kinase domain [Macleaya cordata]|uniref:Protein kinase domain n=1 Tax=Macleaya cordata TaxID=56857 RepID=A0A200R8K1_MACCD|nr:Protein kinase domain [Macleaya cordata]